MLSCHMTLFFAFVKAPLSGAVLVTGSRYSRLSAIFFATQPVVVRGGLFLFLAYAQVESSHRLMWVLCWKSFPRFLSWKHLKVKKKKWWHVVDCCFYAHCIYILRCGVLSSPVFCFHTIISCLCLSGRCVTFKWPFHRRSLVKASLIQTGLLKSIAMIFNSNELALFFFVMSCHPS